MTPSKVRVDAVQITSRRDCRHKHLISYSVLSQQVSQKITSRLNVDGPVVKVCDARCHMRRGTLFKPLHKLLGSSRKYGDLLLSQFAEDAKFE